VADKQVRVDVTANASQARREFEGFSAAVKSSVGGVQGVAMGLHSQILGLGAALAGSAFVVGIKNQVDLMDATRKAAQSTGLSVQAYDELRYAAKLADVEQEVLTKSLAKLSVGMVAAAGGDKQMKALFEDTLGIKVREAGGAMRATDKVLEDLAGRFAAMEDGPKKVAMAAQIFGEKMGPRLIPFLNQGKEGIQQLREELRSLAGVMTDEDAAAAEQFNDNMARAHIAAQGFQRTVAIAVLPTMVEFSNFFVQAAKDVGFLQAAWLTFGKAVARGFGFDEIGKEEVKLKGLMFTADLAEKNLAEMQERLKSSPANATFLGVVDKLKEKLALLAPQIAASRAEIARIRLEMNPPAPPTPKKSSGPDVTALVTTPPVNRVQQWQTELSEKKLKVEEAGRLEGVFREMSKAEEQAYWEMILKTQKVSSEESLAVRRLVADAGRAIAKGEFEARIAGLNAERDALGKDYELRISVADEAYRYTVQKYGAESKEAVTALEVVSQERQKFHEQNRALQNAASQARKAEALDEADTLVRNAELAVALGTLNQAQLLQIRATALDKREAAEIAATQAEIAAMAGGPQDPVAYERLQAQLAEIRARYKGQKAENAGAQKLDDSKAFDAFFGVSSQAVEQGLQQAVQRMSITLNGMRAVLRSIGQAMITELAVKPLAAWMTSQARLVVMTAVFGQQKVVAEGQTAAQIMAIQAGMALRNIATKAAEAAANAYNAIVGIPYVGPFLAPAAAATAFLAVGSFARRIFSAEGGFDIPAGMNPMVQAHAREMILPAKHADVIRSLADRGQGAGGSSGGLQVTLKAAPLKGNFFVIHRDDLLSALRGAKRDFAL